MADTLDLDGAPDSPAQTGPIVVYGATGFIGRLTAWELRRRGADVLLAGRNREKLTTLSEELEGVPIAPVALDDTAGLRSMLEPCAAVVACAGPFTQYGEPLVAAAADTGTNYLNPGEEQAFTRMVFDRFGDRAAATGAALVPGATGYGDLIAALTADGLGALDEISFAACVDLVGAPTRGLALSGFEAIGGEDLIWDRGSLRPGPWHLYGRRWRFPEPVGARRMTREAGIEHITVPRHVATERVNTMWTSWVRPPVPWRVTRLRLILRTPLRRRFEATARRLPEATGDWARKIWGTVYCEARVGSRRRRGTVEIADSYQLTAATLAEAALLCASPRYDREGALAPSQAFDPAGLLDALGEAGLSYEVEPLLRRS
jgi:Saccharopine dehydrogenase NADP binding domain